MIGNILSPTHLLLVLAVALIVLGPKRLPEAGRGLGSAIRGFKESLSTDQPSETNPAIETSDVPDETPGPPRT
jgi:sec-independent protein translocase protein TatA